MRATPQPKAVTDISPRGREEHEVKIFKGINIRNLRGLRVLRGQYSFTLTPEEPFL
jgi:hypothetical protein